MQRATIGKIVKGGAVALDVAAPLTATLTQFPVWVERSSEATVSGMFLLLALISMIPFFKQIREYFKSPDAWVVWCVLFVVFLILQNIVQEMLIVTFVGLLANLIGKCIYKLGEHIGSKPPEGGEDDG